MPSVKLMLAAHSTKSSKSHEKCVSNPSVATWHRRQRRSSVPANPWDARLTEFPPTPSSMRSTRVRGRFRRSKCVFIGSDGWETGGVGFWDLGLAGRAAASWQIRMICPVTSDSFAFDSMNYRVQFYATQNAKNGRASERGVPTHQIDDLTGNVVNPI